MAHELHISKTTGKASFVEFSATGQRVAWHGLGTVLKEAPDSQTAMKEASLDWTVGLRDVAFNATINADGGTMDVSRVIPGVKAVVRSDTQLSLGIVSDRYNPVQNHESFNFLDSLNQDGILRYETAGALGAGERVFMTAQMAGDWEVGGDRMAMYLLAFNSHDGSSAFEVKPVSVRVVCANTLRIARSSTLGISFRHSASVKEKMEAASFLFGAVSKKMDSWVEVCNKMNDVTFSKENFTKLIEEVYPIEEDATERSIKRVEEKRAYAMGVWVNDITQPERRDTVWGALNAITRVEDTFTKQIFKGNKEEGRFLYSVEGAGDAIKQKAQAMLIATMA